MFRTKVVEKSKKKNFNLNNVFENRAIYETMWKNAVEPGRPRRQHDTFALHAGYLRLPPHTHNT